MARAGWVPSAWAKLTEASPRVVDPEERNRARLVASLVLPLAIIGSVASLALPYLTQPVLTVWTSPGVLIGFLASVFLLVAYALARTTHHRAGARLTVAIATLGAWGAAAGQTGADTIAALYFTAVPVMLASLILGAEGTLATAIINAAALLVGPLADPHLSYPIVAAPLVFLAMSSSLSLIAGALRRAEIQERVRAEASLRGQKELYESLLHAQSELGEGCVLVGADQRVVYANEAYCRLTGYTAPELVALPSLMALAAPDEMARLSTLFAQRRTGARVMDHYETVLVRKDGACVEVEVSRRPVEGTGANLVLVLVRDITERKVAESALRESESRFRALSDAALEGIVLHSDGAILECNSAFARLYGIERERVVGMHFVELVAPESRAVVDEQIAAGKHDTYEVTGLRPDGARMTLEVSARWMPYLGRRVRVTAVRDVTARRRAEAELEESRRQVMVSEKLSALGTLVAGVAHEINNPLTFMRARLELTGITLADALARDDLAPETRATLEKLAADESELVRAIERLAHLTHSLKRMSRASDGVQAPEDLNALVDSVLTVATPRLDKSIRVEKRLHATRRAMACEREILQVILNLVFNAGEAMAPQLAESRGTGELTVRTFDERERVVIEVSDTGPGIPEELGDRIFTPFFTTKPQGTGLGLSISYRIIENHGGRLTFTSAPGRGTTFRVELPAARLPEIGSAKGARDAPSGAALLPAPRSNEEARERRT
ncbi:MAG: PAS domain-containing sensor histidine kinase [Thermoplasmatota archaeon]